MDGQGGHSLLRHFLFTLHSLIKLTLMVGTSGLLSQKPIIVDTPCRLSPSVVLPHHRSIGRSWDAVCKM